MRRKRKILIFMIGCLALLLTGSSFAFWSGSVEHTNTLKADQMNAKIEETFQQGTQPSGTVTKKVSFRNDSTNAAFLRVAYAETWKKETGEEDILLNNQQNGTDVAIKNWKNGFGENNGLWTDGGDGWFYYNRILKPDESTSEILESVTFPEYTEEYRDYREADYQLYFRMELLQASDSQATLNRDEVNKKASLTVFGKEAVINDEKVEWN